MDENIIAARKQFSRLMNNSKQQAKKSECLWCGEKITRFCNSHSLPQCILRNIDTDGKIEEHLNYYVENAMEKFFRIMKT